jgi:hypothetical protein
MSTNFKLNFSCITVILSSLSGAFGVIWIASTKARDIEVAQVDINSLKTAVVRVEHSTSTLEERSKIMLDMQKTVESRLHGIATQLGTMRQEARGGY